jgi:hypothetical protein
MKVGDGSAWNDRFISENENMSLQVVLITASASCLIKDQNLSFKLWLSISQHYNLRNVKVMPGYSGFKMMKSVTRYIMKLNGPCFQTTKVKELLHLIIFLFSLGVLGQQK